MVTICLRDISVPTIIGTLKGEREHKQTVILNVSFDYDATQAAVTDDFKHAIDYQDIETQIVVFVENARFQLLETLANQVLRLMMKEIRIQSASVTIDKPQALDVARSVAITMTSERV